MHEPIAYSEAVEDSFDGGEPQEEQEPGEQQDDREAHLLGGGLVGGLCLGELVGAKRDGLGRQAGAHFGALGAGQGDVGGQLGQLADPELVAEPTEGRPGGLPGQAGLVERSAQGGECPAFSDAGRVGEGGLDAASPRVGSENAAGPVTRRATR
jgi:hypothetical protein